MLSIVKYRIRLVTGLLVLALAPSVHADAVPAAAAPRRNLIIMIPDGTGLEATTAARLVKGDALELDSIVLGLEKTVAVGTPVTDSAASATAIATGVITRNGRVGVDADNKPVASIMEAAAEVGYATGLVATSRITHATPACFGAHVVSRGSEDAIALQFVASKIELFLGGGLRHFDSRKDDDRNLVEELRSSGATVATGTDGLQALDPKAEGRIFGLFTPNHLPYELDREAEGGPSLTDMTLFALDWAKARKDRGFVLMIEGSRVDHAAHGNDTSGMIGDLLEFDRAVGIVRKFAEADGNTLVIITADHATGGFSIGAKINNKGIYDFDAEALREIKASGERIGKAIDESRSNISAVLSELAGFTPSEAEIAEIKAATGNYEPGNTINRIVSRHLFAGWTTDGHTGVDVIRYGFGPGSEDFRATMHHSELGRKMQEYLGLRETVDAITARLQAEAAANPAPPLTPQELLGTPM